MCVRFRSLGQGLSPNMQVSPSVHPARSPAAQRDSGSLLQPQVAGSPSSMPPLRAPLAMLSSSDLVRSPSAFINGRRGLNLSREVAGYLSPINELVGAAGEGQETVPDTQSVDGSPLCPTCVHVPSQFSQALQRPASQALTRTGSQVAPHLQPASASGSPQQPVLLHASCGASNGAAWSQQPAGGSLQCIPPAAACANVSNPPAASQAAPSRGHSQRAVQQQQAASKTRQTRKRSSCDMTATTPLLSTGETDRRGKHSRRPSCTVTPDASNSNSGYPKFHPPICDSQPKEVAASVGCKKRRITATCVDSSTRSQDVFKMAGFVKNTRTDKVCNIALFYIHSCICACIQISVRCV
jgi:hypothetical protein